MAKTVLEKAKHFFQRGDYSQAIRLCEKNVKHIDYSNEIEELLKLSYAKRIEQFYQKKEFESLMVIFENSYNLFKTYAGIDLYFHAVACTGKSEKLKPFLKNSLDRRSEDSLMESIGFLALKDEKEEANFCEHMNDLSEQKNKILNCLSLYSEDKKEELLNELGKISLNSVYKKLGLILKVAINITNEEKCAIFYERFKDTLYGRLVTFIYCYKSEYFRNDAYKKLPLKTKSILRGYLDLSASDIKLMSKLEGLPLTSENVVSFIIDNKKLLSNYNFTNLIVPYLNTAKQVEDFEHNFHILPKFEKFKILAIDSLQKEDLSDAIKYLTAALEQLSENIPFSYELRVVLYYFLAKCFQEIGKTQKAIDAFTASLALKREHIYENLIELYFHDIKKNKNKIFEILSEYKKYFPQSAKYILQTFKVNSTYNSVTLAISDLISVLERNKKFEFPIDEILEFIRKKISTKGLNRSLNDLKLLPQCEAYQSIIDALLFIHKKKKPSKQDSNFGQQLCYSIEYYLTKKRVIRLHAQLDAKELSDILFLYKEYELKELLSSIINIDSEALQFLNLEEALTLCEAFDMQFEAVLLSEASNIFAERFKDSLEIIFYKYFTRIILSPPGIVDISIDDIINQMAFFLYYAKKLNKKNLLDKILFIFVSLKCEPTISYRVKKLPHDLRFLNKVL